MKKATPAGKGRKVTVKAGPIAPKYGTNSAPQNKSAGYVGIKKGASKVAGNTTAKPRFNAAAFARARAKHFNLPQPGSTPKVNLYKMPKAKGEKQVESRKEDLGRA